METKRMNDVMYLKTEKFEHRIVRNDFINPISFGDDFALWLISRLDPLRFRGFTISTPIMEDYGHGFRVAYGKDRFWVALSFAELGPTEEAAHWVVTVDCERGLNPFKRLFRKPEMKALQELRDSIWEVIRNDPEITEFTEEQWRKLA